MSDRALATVVVAFFLACAIATVAAQTTENLRIVCEAHEFAGYVVRACEVRP
jgi:hypothetical protein